MTAGAVASGASRANLERYLWGVTPSLMAWPVRDNVLSRTLEEAPQPQLVCFTEEPACYTSMNICSPNIIKHISCFI